MRETPCSPTRQIHTDIAIKLADDAPFHCFPPPAWSRDRLFWYNFFLFFLPSGIAYSCGFSHIPWIRTRCAHLVTAVLRARKETRIVCWKTGDYALLVLTKKKYWKKSMECKQNLLRRVPAMRTKCFVIPLSHCTLGQVLAAVCFSATGAPTKVLLGKIWTLRLVSRR